MKFKLALPLWTIVIPVIASVLYFGKSMPLGGLYAVLLSFALIGSVMAAVHHAKGHATAGEGSNIVVARAIYVIFSIIILLILLRMVLLMMGVSTTEPLANLVYMVSGVFLAPFFFIFGYAPTYGAPVFEIGSLMAVLFYMLIGWGLAFMVTFGSWHSDDV